MSEHKFDTDAAVPLHELPADIASEFLLASSRESREDVAAENRIRRMKHIAVGFVLCTVAVVATMWFALPSLA